MIIAELLLSLNLHAVSIIMHDVLSQDIFGSIFSAFGLFVHFSHSLLFFGQN